MTKEEYQEKKSVLKREAAAIEHEIAKVEREYMESINEPYKRFYGKKVEVEYKKVYNRVFVMKGYWWGIKIEYGLLKMELRRPKKDGSIGQRVEWAFFDEIVSIKEIE